MSDSFFISHILELRKRVVTCLLIYSLVAIPLIVFAKPVFELITHWLFISSGNHSLIATDIASTFMVPIKCALILSVFITVPFMLYQIWAFITPGLYPHEKKSITVFFVLSVLLFYIGALFAYLLVCPLALQFFLMMSPEQVYVMTDINHYLSFLTTMVLSFGLGFQVPIIVCVCIMSGLCSEEWFKGKRRYIIVMAFIAGMLLTPPDVISQILLAVPLLMLFELGLVLARLLKKHPNPTIIETSSL